jgi:transposase InsO family protein
LIVGEAVTGPVEGTGKTVDIKMGLPITDIILRTYSAEGVAIDIKIRALIDSGSEISIISNNKIKLMDNIIIDSTSEIKLTNAVQNEITTINRKFKCNVFFPQNRRELINKTFYIMEQNMEFEGIIGIDIMHGLPLKFLKSGAVKFYNILIRKDNGIKQIIDTRDNDTFYEFINNSKRVINKVKSKENKIIMPRYFDWVKIKREVVGQNNLGVKESYGNPELINLGIICATIPREETNIVKIFNNSDSIVEILEGTLLILEVANETKSCNILIKATELGVRNKRIHENEFQEWKRKRKALIDSNSVVSEIEEKGEGSEIRDKTGLKNLLEKYNDIFSRTPSDAGFSKELLLDFQFKSEKDKIPFYATPYKTADSVADKLEAKISEMIESGILEVCNSPWNSPVISVAKKDGSIRIVNNFAVAVNKRLVMPRFPLLPTRTIFAQVGKEITRIKNLYPGEQIVFSSMDFRSGYFSLPIVDSSRDCTAFAVGGRQVRYRKCPQGVSIAPSCYSSYIYGIFGNFKYPGAYVQHYLDDGIVVAAESVLLPALEEYFKVARNNNVIIALQKCTFGVTKLEYLGHILSNAGVEACPKKHKAILDLPDPTNMKEGQQLAGILNYYSRLTPRLSTLLAPLYREISYGRNFKPNTAINNGIKMIKELIKNGLGTHHLNYSTLNGDTIFVCCDSSLMAAAYCVGNCKKQGDDYKEFRIAAYGSKPFEPAVAMQSSRSRELIGLSYALEHFADLLEPSLEFISIVDHKSLTNITTNKSLGKTSTNTRVRKALATILNFAQMEIIFADNKSEIIMICDGLSRLITTTEKVPAINIRTVYNCVGIGKEINTIQPKIEIENLIKQQKLDDKLKEIIEKIGNSKGVIEKIGGKNYIISQNGLLKLITDKQKALTIIPKNVAFEIVDYLHQQSSHSGIKRMLVHIRNSEILIPNKTKLLTDIANKCIFCQSLRKNKQPEVNAHIKPSTEPFKHVFIDLMNIEGYGNNNYKHVLTMIDLFSGFCDGRVIGNKTSELVCRELLFLVHRHSLSNYATVTFDNGREFQNELLKTSLEKLKIVTSNISPYNSRANRVERFHRSLRHILKTTRTTSKDLKLKIEMAIMTHNQLPSERHNMMSPFEIIYGRQPKSHLDYLKFPDEPESQKIINDGSQTLEWYEHLSNQHVMIASQHIISYKNLVNLDLGKVFNIGDMVLVFDPITNLSNTQSPKSEGPYKILSKNLNSYKLAHMFTGTRLIRNHRYVRAFRITEKLREALESNYITISENNTINILNDQEIENEILIPDINEGEQDKGEKLQRYNLRPRV